MSISFLCQDQSITCLNSKAPVFICPVDLKVTNVKINDGFEKDFHITLKVNDIIMFSCKKTSLVKHTVQVFLNPILVLKVGDKIYIEIENIKNQSGQQIIDIGYTTPESSKRKKTKFTSS